MKNFIITLSAICIFLFAYTNSLRAQCYHGMDINVVELNGVCSNPSNMARVKIEAVVANGCETYYAYGITGITFDGQSIEFPERTPSTFSGLPPGVYVASFYTLTDTDGNITGTLRLITSKNFSVSLVDVIPPVAECKDVSVQLNANGLGAITASDIDDGSFDNCGIASMEITSGQTSYSCEDLDNNFTVELTVTDNLGRIAACSANVTVADDNYHCNRPPVAVCQDITVSADGNCQGNAPAAYFDGGSNDLNLDNLSFSVEPVAPYAVGTSTVTLTVSDPSGASDNCTATITVVDNLAPTALCQDITVQLDANGLAPVLINEVDAGSTDNCGISDMTVSPNTFYCTDAGDNTVTLTATDISGNESSCEATVTVVDNSPPMFNCKDLTLYLDNQGTAGAINYELLEEWTDNCAAPQVLPQFVVFDCSDAGTITPVNLTTTTRTGEIANCTANITVVDAMPPMAICQDATVQLNSDGNGSVSINDIDNYSYDNCSIVSSSISSGQTDYSCEDLGQTFSVELTLTDNAGLSASCSANVRVADDNHPCNQAPIAVCQDITVSADDNCQADVEAVGFDGGSSDPDLDNLSFSVDPAGPYSAGVTAVILTVSDSEFSDACTGTITVEASPATIQMADPVKLWPPDYTYQTFTVEQMVNGLSGDCAGSLDDVWIAQASSDELEDDPGTQDGNTLNDMVVSADCRSIQVRKERMGGGNGRVYTVMLAVADADGNINYSDYKISVPKWAWGWNSEAVEDDVMYTAECGAESGGAVIAQNGAPFPTVDLQEGKMDLGGVQLSVYPNPFDTHTNISFQLSKAAFTIVEIYDLQGRWIRQLHNAQLSAGEHRLGWDGADASGAPTPSGLYLIRLQTGNETIHKKALLQRR